MDEYHYNNITHFPMKLNILSNDHTIDHPNRRSMKGYIRLGVQRIYRRVLKFACDDVRVCMGKMSTHFW